MHWFLPNINMNQPSVYPCKPPTSLPIPALDKLLTEPQFEFRESYNKFLLAVYFTCGNVCFRVTLSIPPTLSSFHPSCVRKSVLHVCLHCCSANRFISAIFLDSICVHWYAVFVFLFLTYFTLYNRF